MIRVERGPEPEILASSKLEWLTKLAEATTEKRRKQLERNYSHVNIRAALEQSFFRKCAYCESFIKHVGYGHIDHFRPKSNPLYGNLIFEWSNLLLSCEMCNSRHKGVRFPEMAEDGPIIDPCNEDPALHLSFEYDPVAGLATVSFLTVRGETTLKVLGLNRPDLREHRSLFVKKLHVLISFCDRDPAAKALLVQAKQGDAEYAAFARSLMTS